MDNPDIKVILFDIDDTLFDAKSAFNTSLEWINAAWGSYSKSIHSDTTKSNEEKLLLDDSQRNAQNYSALALKEDKPRPKEELILVAKAIYETGSGLNLKEESPKYWTVFLEHAVAYSDVFMTLSKLKELGYTVIAVSDFDYSVQKSKLESLGLFSYFDFIFTKDKAGGSKKSGALYSHVRKELACHFYEMLMVGDDIESDIQTPNSLGMYTALIKNTYSDYLEEEVKKADIELKKISNLLDFFDKKIEGLSVKRTGLMTS